MSALDDVVKILDEGELPELIVFGNWAGGCLDTGAEIKSGEPGCTAPYWRDGDDPPDSPPVPLDVRGKPVLWDKAVRDGYFEGWSFTGGYGGVDCYAVTIWTDRSVIVVGCYDGSSWLQKVPRNPAPHWPESIGGG